MAYLSEPCAISDGDGPPGTIEVPMKARVSLLRVYLRLHQALGEFFPGLTDLKHVELLEYSERRLGIQTIDKQGVSPGDEQLFSQYLGITCI